MQAQGKSATNDRMDPQLSKKIKILSFISIILVVLLHAWNLRVRYPSGTIVLNHPSLNVFLQNFISDGIARISVPLFFAFSGFLFFYNLVPSARAFGDKLKRRVYSLVVPYLLWSLYGLLLFFVLQSIPFSKAYFAGHHIADYTLGQLLDRLVLNPIPYQLWFLHDLIIFSAFTPLIYWAITRLSWLPLAAAFLLWLSNVPLGVVNDDGLLFFILGATFALRRVPMTARHLPWRRASLAVWLGLVGAHTVLLMYAHGPILVWLQKAGIVAGVYAVWTNADAHFAQLEKLLPLSAYTFFIYAFHEPVMTLYKKLLLKLFGISDLSNLLIYLCAPLLAVATSLVAALFLKRYAGTLYGILTGGRVGAERGALVPNRAAFHEPSAAGTRHARGEYGLQLRNGAAVERRLPSGNTRYNGPQRRMPALERDKNALSTSPDDKPANARAPH